MQATGHSHLPSGTKSMTMHEEPLPPPPPGDPRRQRRSSMAHAASTIKTRRALGWVANLLAEPGEHAHLAAATAEAIAAEHVCVSAIEAAMISCQAAAKVADDLQMMRQTSAIAAARAKDRTTAAKKYVQATESAGKALEKAQDAVAKAKDAVEAAQQLAINAVDGEIVAKAAAEQAQTDVYEATEAHEAARRGARNMEEELKNSKKAREGADRYVDEAKRAAITAGTSLVKAEERALLEAEKVSDATKRTYTAVQQREEAEEALKVASRAAEEIEGIWLERHMKKVRAIEAEFRRAQATAVKAQTEEDQAEQRSDKAQETLRLAQADLPRRKQEAEDAAAAAIAAGEKVARVVAETEESQREEAAKKEKAEESHKALKSAQARARRTTVQGAEDELMAAKQQLYEANQWEKDRLQNAERTRKAAVTPIAEADTAHADAELRASEVELAAEPERDALQKEDACNAAVLAFEASVNLLSLEVFSARFEQQPFWTAEENTEMAAAAQADRLERMVCFDVEIYTSGKERKRNAQWSALDKWRLFKAEADDGKRDLDHWCVQRLLYEADGAIVGGITMIVSHLIGLALERAPAGVAASLEAELAQLALLEPVEVATDPLTADRCRVTGDGISRAVLEQPSEFVIEAVDELGRRQPQAYSASFFVSIRSTGTRLRAKITDQRDGSYRVVYKPTSTGRCTIAVSVMGESLPGSPFTCLVRAPTAHASRCEVLAPGDEWTIVARESEHFRVIFRDILGSRLRHPVELDVYAQHVGGWGVQATNGHAAPAAAATTGLTMGISSTSADDANGAYLVRMGKRVALPTLPAPGESGDVPAGAFDLLRTLDEFESLVVGGKGLAVTKAKSVESDRIGLLPPGHALDLIRLELVSPQQDEPVDRRIAMGLHPPPPPPRLPLQLRACIVYDPARQDSWRQLYPSHQDWRTLSWRDRSEEYSEQSTRRAEQASERTFTNLPVSSRASGGKLAPKPPTSTRTAKKAKRITPSAAPLVDAIVTDACEEVLATLVEAEAMATSCIPEVDSAAAASTATTETAGSVVAAQAPAPAAAQASARPPATRREAAKASSKGGKNGATRPASKKTAVQKQLSKKEIAEQEAQIKVTEERAMRELMAKVTSVTLLQSWRRKMLSQRRTTLLRQEAAKAEAAKAAAAAAALQAKLKAENQQSRSLARAAVAAREKLGKLKLNQNPSFGWVTLWTMDDAEPLVAKEMGQLPAHIRRQHIENWNRRFAIDSARERERARLRDEELETAAVEALSPSTRPELKLDRTQLALRDGEHAKRPRPKILQTKSPTWLRESHRPPSSPMEASRFPSDTRSPSAADAKAASSLSHTAVASARGATGRAPNSGSSGATSNRLGRSDRAQCATYLEELEADQLGGGFAYGGVTGGRGADSDGAQPIDHLVHFSIGRTGCYLLHVGLRTGAPLPGSPFTLNVRPGVAHPLSTQIPAEQLPVLGYLKWQSDSTKARAAGTKTSPGIDMQRGSGRMTMGGSEGGGARGAASCTLRLLTRDKMGNLCDRGGAIVACGCVGGDSEGENSAVVDNGDGTYELRWWVTEAGTYEVYVKLDGLHVLGSPAAMRIYRDQATYTRNDPVAKAAMEAEARARQRVEQLAEQTMAIVWEYVFEAEYLEATKMVQDELDVEKYTAFRRAAAERRASMKVCLLGIESTPAAACPSLMRSCHRPLS